MADIENQESIGRKRFYSGIEFEKQLLSLARSIQSRMLDNLPSNYSRDPNTNVAELLRSISEEFSRLQTSTSSVNEDRYHSETRAEYLYQILGDVLFLDQNAINYEIADTEYRDFLIKVRNAYYGGSRKDNLESSVSSIIGLPVTLHELYLQARRTDSFYTVKDTHTMFFDILMDSLSSTSNLGLILQDVKFFLDLIKPAHVLYDTRLIWTDTYTGTDGACTPSYDSVAIPDTIYYGEKIYEITYLVDRLFVFDGTDPEETWVEGKIASLNSDRKLIHLEDDRILVVAATSTLYERTINPDLTYTDTEITFASLEVGDDIRYYATIDSVSSTTTIDTDWEFTGVVDSIDESIQIITLDDGSVLVYNDDTLAYTRDYQGEYRINIVDLLIGRTIVFKGKEYHSEFQFYNIPEQIVDNPYKQYDQAVIDTPLFQGNVKKNLKTRDDQPEGPYTYVEDGVVYVTNIESKFYKRDNAETKKDHSIWRYSLYFGDTYTDQFSIEEPDENISEEEARQRFMDMGYGLTGTVDYGIDIDQTGSLVDSDNDAIVETINDVTETCEQKAECLLIPEYEDSRNYAPYPDVRLTSGFVYAPIVTPVPIPGGQNLPAYFNISSEANEYRVPLLPMLNALGNIASTSDLVVYVDGLRTDDAIQSVDPWTGQVELNFLPPANTVIRIDYYYAARYPYRKSYMEEVGVTRESQRLLWPYTLTETGAYNLGGGIQDFQVDLFPILSREGLLAGATHIGFYVGDLGVTGTVIGKETGVGQDVLVVDGGVSGIYGGDTLVVNASNYLDNTMVYQVVGVTGTDKIVTGEEFVADFTPEGFSFKTIRFTGATYNIDDVRPLLGHIHVDSVPVTGTFVRFDYYYTHQTRSYALIPDVPGETSPYMDMGYTVDAIYGSRYGYNLIPDRGYTGWDEPVYEHSSVAKRGYRYRAFSLADSSVMDSQDTLVYDGYQKYYSRASVKNNGDKIDNYNVMFSPEFITDRDKSVILNDAYLAKEVTPVTQLYPGVPPFVKTFSDDGHFKDQEHPTSESTFEEPTGETHDIEAGFTIVGADISGQVDYQPVCNYPENKRLSLYSGLKLVETEIAGFEEPLATIQEGQRTIPFRIDYIDQYYPDREKRLNDYLDYINRIPEDVKTGVVKTMKGSVTVKKVSGTWLNLKIGDMFRMQNVPVRAYNKITHEWGIVEQEKIYTVVEIIDYETARLSTAFKEQSGEYTYELIRDTVYNVDVVLNGSDGRTAALNRILVLNGLTGYTYGLPDSYLSTLPGYGDTGAHAELYFDDPDHDPYPRSPNNPNITGLPTGSRAVLVTKETGLGPTDIDAIPLTSEIIGANGSSVVGSLSGFTGPSGAVDLGLTGPTGEYNPRIQEADDKYVIPSCSTGVFWSYSEAEHRVMWRNWDQEMIFISFGGATGANVVEEEPLGLYDDVAEGLKRSYWNVNLGVMEEKFYYGTVIETSERIIDYVMVVNYPKAVIVLNADQALEIASSLDPLTDFSYLNPGITSYHLRRRVIRELLHDDSIRVTEVQEFEPV